MGAEQALLPQFHDKEDPKFASTLLRHAMNNASSYRELIDEQSSNWTGERIAFMDTVIMVAALSEITSFSDIPLGVTLSEYVEIAKYYSTPSSASFINGVLDGAAKKLRSKNQ